MARAARGAGLRASAAPWFDRHAGWTILRVPVLIALLATVIWTCSSWFSARGSRHLSGVSGNLVRLAVSLPLAVLVAVLMGTDLLAARQHPATWWFVLSGVVGMGLCDIAMLLSFSRLGLRLPSLLNNGCGALMAAVVGWCWLGESLGLWQALAIAAVIAGLAAAVWPARGELRADAAGIAYGVAAGLLFGLSAAITRHGFECARDAGADASFLEVTALRLAGGALITGGLWLALIGRPGAVRDGAGDWRRGAPLLAINGVLGAGAGVTVLNWALATTPVAQVQAVIATLPAMVLILGWITGDSRPSLRSILGTALCVAAVIWLTMLR